MNARPRKSPASLCRPAVLWLALVLLVLALPAQPLPAAETKAVSENPETLDSLPGVSLDKAVNWREAWEDGRSELSNEALAVLSMRNVDRARVKAELQAVKDKKPYAAAANNLDAGRHSLLKQLVRAAVREANNRLKARGLSPLEKVVTVNSGGFGDFARDQDITAFAGDPLRSKVFFESLMAVANKPYGIPAAYQNATLGADSGVTLPGLEVTFHSGANELPDSVGSTDLQNFALDYRRVIERQSQMPEAYYGHGAETEVQGRRVTLAGTPGGTRMQIFKPEGATVSCTSVFNTSADQVFVHTRYQGGSRVRRSQNSVHIVNDALQAAHHRQDPSSSTSQGPLKYAGRALDHLAQFAGMKPWAELAPEDRTQLLLPLFESAPADQRVKLAESMARHLEVAEYTFRNKKAPETIGNRKATPDDYHAAETAALIFIKKAAVHTAASIATEMMHPPPFDYALLENLKVSGGRHFADLPFEEQLRLAQRHDKAFQENISVAAMENLLVTMRALQHVDALSPGLARESIQRIVDGTRVPNLPDAEQPPLHQVMKLAAEHAEVSALREASSDPAQRRALGQRMDKLRFDISQRAAAYTRTTPVLTGAALVEQVRKVPVKRLIQSFDTKSLPPELAALDQHRAGLQELAFPRDAKDASVSTESLKASLKAKGGLRTAAAERFYEEAFQLGNVTTGLQLLEMYQNGAEYEEYGKMMGLELAGRYRWYLGYAGQAVMAKNMREFEDLGKNMVFDLASRFIPGAGTAKLVFDIEQGLVNVTVGYTFNKLNTSLIDAVYTGRHGRINTGTEGKRAGIIRDAELSVLNEKQVLRKEDPKTKAVRIVVDKPAVYRDFFQAWTGIPPNDDFVIEAKLREGEALVAADRKLREAIRRSVQEKEPLWVGTESVSFNPDDMKLAMEELTKAATPHAAKLCSDILSQLAVREFYVKNEDGIPEDQILGGLKARLLGDFVYGMIETTQNEVMRQAVVKRRLDGLADAGDMAALGDALAQEVVKPRPAPSTCFLRVSNGLPSPQSEMDGTGRLHFQVEVVRSGGAGNAPAVDIEIEPGKAVPVEESYRPHGMIMGGEVAPRSALIDSAAWSQDVVLQPVEVRALSGGAILSKKTHSFYVRLKKWSPKKLKLEEIVLPNSAWPSVFYSGVPYRRSIKRLTGPQALESWDLEPGRHAGFTAHAKEIYNTRVLGGAPGQVPEPDDIKISDEQELDMSWVLERADGGSTRIDSPDLNSPEQRSNPLDVSCVVVLTQATKGRLTYKITRNNEGVNRAFDGSLVFLCDGYRGRIRMKTRTSSQDGRSGGVVNEANMPDLMANLARALASRLEGLPDKPEEKKPARK